VVVVLVTAYLVLEETVVVVRETLDMEVGLRVLQTLAAAAVPLVTAMVQPTVVLV
jgi:hypothetical protein